MVRHPSNPFCWVCTSEEIQGIWALANGLRLAREVGRDEMQDSVWLRVSQGNLHMLFEHWGPVELHGATNQAGQLLQAETGQGRQDQDHQEREVL